MTTQTIHSAGTRQVIDPSRHQSSYRESTIGLLVVVQPESCAQRLLLLRPLHRAFLPTEHGGHAKPILYILEQFFAHWSRSFSCAAVDASLNDDPSQRPTYDICLWTVVSAGCKHHSVGKHLAYSLESWTRRAARWYCGRRACHKSLGTCEETS